jgi:uncharacterized protein affecting Mg2+/Co2+ transport
MPFGISAFTSILRNNSLASLVETSTAQVDSWYTTPSETVTVDLVSSDDSVLIDGSVWAYSGNVINTSDKELSYITVIVKVNDSQGNLVAMDYTTISNPEGTIKPGDTYQFSVTLYLDPTVDATGFTATSLAIGDQN